LTGSTDKTAILWTTAGSKVRTFEGHTGGVSSVAFSPDGQYILTGNRYGTAILWTTAGSKVRTFEGHTGLVFSVAFSPDGKYILTGSLSLTGSTDETAKLWESGIDVVQKPKFPASLQITGLRFEDSNLNKAIDGNETCYLKFKVSNTGKGDAYKMEVKVKETNGITDLTVSAAQKLNILQAGTSQEISVPVSGGLALANGKANFQILITEGNGFDADAVSLEVETRALRTPKLTIPDFSFSSEQGGEMQLGTLIVLKVVLQNTGQGEAKAINVKFSLPENVFATSETAFQIPVLRSGESKVIDFEFFTNKRYTGSSISVGINASESWGKYGASQTAVVSLNQKLMPTKVVVEGLKEQPQAPTRQIALQSDVDKNIPVGKVSNPDAIAVVIGNRDYKNTKNVDYALHDSRTVKNYLTTALGFKEGNILYYENISLDEFNTIFGSEKKTGRLHDVVKAGISDVFIYYSGHGAPEIETQTGYFVPVGCDPNYVSNGGYSLETFYHNLSKVPAKSMTIVLDACFSGAELIEQASPIGIKPQKASGLSNGIILASSTGTQLSNWYAEQQHGLFTYFFLKAIHNRNADKDKNGKLTFDEIFQYVSDKANGVPYHSRRLHGGSREQTPVLEGGGDGSRVFMTY
jgi:hypothetical protein